MDHFKMWTQVLPNLNVDTSIVEPLYGDSVPVLLAMLLGRNGENDVSKRLLALRYSDVEVRQVLFLMNFRRFEPSIAFRTRKSFAQSGLAKHQLFEYAFKFGPDSKLVSAFGAYLLAQPVKGDDLLALGFSGHALGKEMERRELEIFEGLLGALK
jgi:hypothetical protein